MNVSDPYTVSNFEHPGPQNIGGAGGSSGAGTTTQIVAYTGASPSGAPPASGSPAWAYKKDGTGPSLGWNIDTQAWN
jgi:hypothetical protein